MDTERWEGELYLEQVVHLCPLHHYFALSLGGFLCCPSSREVFLH